MQPPPPFTRQLPESAPNRDQPDWVACRFDGFPDFRSDLSIAGLRVIAKWPGEWAWCEDTDLRALILGQPAQGATGDSEVVRLRELAKEAIDYIRNCGEELSINGQDLREKLEGKA